MSTSYQPWKHAVKTALLGTAQAGDSPFPLPETLREAAQPVQDSTTGSEQLFLRLTSLIWQYSRAGFLPAADPAMAPTPAPPETQPYCSSSAIALLRQLIEEEEQLLLTFWLRQCQAAGQVIPPLHLPPLLDCAFNTPALRPQIMEVAGNRGWWLCQFFPDWQKLPVLSGDLVWTEGTPRERAAVLRQIREQHPLQGLSLLRESWAGENAANKELFLGVLATGLGAPDEPFLLQAAKEKSQKVKRQAAELLFSLAESDWVQQCTALALNAIRLQPVRTLLVMTRMTAVASPPAALPPELIAAGLEPVSSTANLKDEVFALQQVVARTPPAQWKAHFGMSADKVVSTFTADLQQYLPALCEAVRRFGDGEFAMALLQLTEYTEDLLACVPETRREEFALKLPGAALVNQIDALCALPQWSERLSRKVIQCWHSDQSPYAVQAGMKLYLLHLAPASTQIMRSLSFPDEYAQRMWNAAANELERFSALQTSVKQAFITQPS